MSFVYVQRTAKIDKLLESVNNFAGGVFFYSPFLSVCGWYLLFSNLKTVWPVTSNFRINLREDSLLTMYNYCGPCANVCRSLFKFVAYLCGILSR